MKKNKNSNCSPKTTEFATRTSGKNFSTKKRRRMIKNLITKLLTLFEIGPKYWQKRLPRENSLKN
jgi:hypothetical protein